MAPVITNSSPLSDDDQFWKTYYLRVSADGGIFYKIGRCKGSVKRRYRQEPPDTEIEILQLWPHKTETAAIRHEEKLFRTHKGDRPFIGRCGPFRFGGNTETYSHDVIGGKPPPSFYIVRIYRKLPGCHHPTSWNATESRASPSRTPTSGGSRTSRRSGRSRSAAA